VSWLALPVVLLFYIIGFAWKRSRPHRAMEIDLDVSDPLMSLFADLKADLACRRFRLDENRS
jgi:amino acid transporter